MLDNTITARNFSKSAGRYDQHANMQRLAAHHLMKEIPEGACRRILEIGCGTGIYTQLLMERFAYSDITAVDISGEMIRSAREKIDGGNVAFEVGDAEKMTLYGKYDLITSNSVIQWFSSVETALKRYSGALNEGRSLAFSAFGPLTFTELAAALRSVRTDRQLSVASRNFPDREALERLLGRHFGKVSVGEIIARERYPSLEALLKKIKHTGVRGGADGSGYIWSQGLLREVEEAYMNAEGGITATYQIFICKAER